MEYKESMNIKFKYSEGKAIDENSFISPLSGQDGWIADDDSSIIITDDFAISGKQSAYNRNNRKSSSAYHILKNRYEDNIIIFSAWFYTPVITRKGIIKKDNLAEIFITDIDKNKLIWIGIEQAYNDYQVVIGVDKNITKIKIEEELQDRWILIKLEIDSIRKCVQSGAVKIMRTDMYVTIEETPETPIINENIFFEDTDFSYMGITLNYGFAIDDLRFGEESYDFEKPLYGERWVDQNIPGIMKHIGSFPEIKKRAYFRFILERISNNPIVWLDDIKRPGLVIRIGKNRNGNFAPVISIGYKSKVINGRADIKIWCTDDKFDYYGCYLKPNIRSIIDVEVDIESKKITVYGYCENEDQRYILCESSAFSDDTIDAVNEVEVKQYENLCSEIHMIADNEPICKDTYLSKPTVMNRIYNETRSFWSDAGRHVVIEKNQLIWNGFPDIVKAQNGTIICVYVNGERHGGGGQLLVKNSYDNGRTWTESVILRQNGQATARITRLKNGKLILIAEYRFIFNETQRVARSRGVVFISSDNGESWSEICEVDPLIIGGHDFCVPSRIHELHDGTLIVMASHSPGYRAWNNHGNIYIEVYRSTNTGESWELYSCIKSAQYSLCEPHIIQMENGKILVIIREGTNFFNGILAESDDKGLTWQINELPFRITGRPCAGLLSNGSIVVTYRDHSGFASTKAWKGMYNELRDSNKWQGIHVRDSRSVYIENESLHITGIGQQRQFTHYRLNIYNGPGDRVEIKSTIKVKKNGGRAASITIPHYGGIRIFSDHVESIHNEEINAQIEENKYHNYIVLCQKKSIQVWIDGELKIDTKDIDDSLTKYPWGFLDMSTYYLAFGNEITTKELSPIRFLFDERFSGCSEWENFDVEINDKQHIKNYNINWTAKEGFPDQYCIEKTCIIGASVEGGDQGYSNWCEIEKDNLLIANYTDDNSSMLSRDMGVTWIRGTYVKVDEL